MRRLFFAAVSLALVGFAAFWAMTVPRALPMAATATLTGDATKGAAVFRAAGCASCHMAPGATGDAQLVLAGGQKFPSDFGTFIAPNISPDPEQGIGGWTVADLANAMTRGISPEGQHYYPAFPYASYIRADLQDVADLKTFLDTLPADATPSQPHQLGFPFTIRRTVGLWKLLFLNADWVVTGALTPIEARGRYLAEALGHCGECHTPRNVLGAMQRDEWLSGAPDPSGKGTIPGIRPAALDWSEGDIVEYLTSGFTPDFDSAGGHMAHVVENLSRLAASEREAIAAYLKKVR